MKSFVTLNKKITYYIDPSDITGVIAFMSLIYNTASSQVLYRKKPEFGNFT